MAEASAAAHALFLFEELSERPDARDTLLAGQPQEVIDLLAALERAAPKARLSFPTEEDARTRRHALPLPTPIGAYRLGEGGMGLVFAADRCDGLFEHRVAIKLIHPDRFSERALDRFAQERRLLARLEHPGIARLLDGGITADGWPYIVMERIDGTQLDRFAAAAPTPGARVTLVEQVCDAVAAAHAALVVRRSRRRGAGGPSMKLWKKAALLLAATSLGAAAPALAQGTPSGEISQERKDEVKRNLGPSVQKWNKAMEELKLVYDQRRAADPTAPTLEEALGAKIAERSSEAGQRFKSISGGANAQATLARLANAQNILAHRSGALSDAQQDAITADSLRAGLGLVEMEDSNLEAAFSFFYNVTEALIPPGTDPSTIVANLDSARALLSYGRQQAARDLGTRRNNLEVHMDETTEFVRNAGVYRDPNDQSDLLLAGANNMRVAIHADGGVTVLYPAPPQGEQEATLYHSKDGQVSPDAQAEIRRILGGDALVRALGRILQINGANGGAGSGLVAGFDVEDVDAATLETFRQALPGGQLPHLPTIPPSAFDAFTSGGGAISSVELEAIYAGYSPALTATPWESLNIYPPGLSSVATVPEVPWYSLSSVGTSLSAAGSQLPIDWISLTAVGSGLPIGGGAYNSAAWSTVAGTSGSLGGPLAWMIGGSDELQSAWLRPGAIDASGLTRLAMALAFGDAGRDREGLTTDLALAGLFGDPARGDPLRSTLELGSLLADSRGILSTGGFSDIGISGLTLGYLLRDFGVEDGDLINITIRQFSRTLYDGQLSLLNAGTAFTQQLRPGVAELTITALNEGSLPPNTAEVTIGNVVRGEATQSYSLDTGQTATLRIESNARTGQ